MHWIYQITAASHPRVLLQIVEFLKAHPLVIRSLDVALLHQSAKIDIAVEADSPLAHRLHAELPHQPNVHHVELLAGHPPAVDAVQSPVQSIRRTTKANRSL